MALIASATAFVACDLIEGIEDLGEAKVSLDLTEVAIPKEGGSATIQIVATRDWEVKARTQMWWNWQTR